MGLRREAPASPFITSIVSQRSSLALKEFRRWLMQWALPSQMNGTKAPSPFNLAVTILDCEATSDPMIGKTKAQPARRKKPRGEQLLDRIDKNPNDREAWNELARGSRIRRKKKKPARQKTR
jgi:hypothetical protein